MPELQVSDEVILYYEEAGQGFPLLLIHGHLTDHSHWRHQIEPFSRKYRVFAVDVKGYGKSTKPTKEYRVYSHADDLYSMLQKLNISQTHICGHSLGGMIAEVFAIKYPDAVRGLILADSAAMIADDAISSRLSLLTDHDMDWWARQGAKRIFRLAPKEEVEYEIGIMRRVDKQDYRLALLSVAGFNIASHLKKIRAPTLIIQGEKDITVPMWHAEQLRTWIPGAQFAIMKGASHMVPLEKPDEFNKLVLDFLAEVDAKFSS